MHTTQRLLAHLLFVMTSCAFADEPRVPDVNDMTRLMDGNRFQAARAQLAKDHDRIVQDIIQLTEIPAPPFKEEARARAYMQMLKAHGLRDVEMDAEGNVMGLREGTDGRSLLVVTAHLDTVFPEDTDVKVRRKGDRLFAPGIADDVSSLAVLLGFIRALDEARIITRSDILFMGNVGEEGPGDLRGVRYLFTRGKYKDRITHFISFESGRARITDAGVGSRRYVIAFKGPGGHSMRDFGLVNPAYAMAGAITEIAKLHVPSEPRTVFNVGVVEGGTSVNSIPFEVSMTVDLRSDGAAELRDLDSRFLGVLSTAAAAENAARSTAKGAISVDVKLIGDRPVGSTPRSADIVNIAAAALLAAGETPQFEAGSTDSNIPMSLGIPAVTLRSGFLAERIHSLEESLLLDQQETVKHMAIGLATVLAIAGPATK